LRYLTTIKVAGRTPYVLLNVVDEVYRSVNVALLAFSDPWVYPLDKYLVTWKLRVYPRLRFILKVTHSDGSENVIKDTRVKAFRFLEGVETVQAANKVGSEVVEFMFKPRIRREEVFRYNVEVREKPGPVIIRFEGGRRARPNVRTVTLPMPRKVRKLGVLGEYEGYERDLRSVFSEYELVFGKELERNLIIRPKRLPHLLKHDGNLTLQGNVNKLLPICLDFKHYLRTPIIFTHTAIAVGGIKTKL